VNYRVRGAYNLFLNGWSIKWTGSWYYWYNSAGLNVRFKLGGGLDDWLEKYLI
jgi:hypothetical protein